MSRRIGLWILAGFAVGCFWVNFSMIVPRGVNFSRWIITEITAPASIINHSIHAPVTFYQFIAMNAAVYGLIGLIIEPFLRISRHRTPVPKP
jgi:hypothetical protein